jgi:hemolysin III
VTNARAKRVLRVLDHVSIYLLIAGTYTPFMLVSLRGGWGWSIFGVIWGLALAGVIAKPFIVNRLRIISPILYILMGWVIIIAVKPVLAALPPGTFFWIMMGGIAYTGGVIFYACDRRLPYNHAIWHVFVMAGSVFHFIAVLFLIPGKA